MRARIDVPKNGEVDLIDFRTLAHNHSLSFTNQPYLEQLFADVLSERPLALIIGAGVSVNAGLPNWNRLIERIIGIIDDAELRDLATQFQGDPLRRAEFVLQLARRRNVNAEEHEFIRDGLYPGGLVARPGKLARSLARLIDAKRPKVLIITTNFDLLIEEALRDQLADTIVTPCGLDDLELWNDSHLRNEIGVLHVHGAVGQAQSDERDGSCKTIKPLILTESHYLKNGATVREQISRALSGAVGLFVGLSLTDPNLIGPLYETAPKKREDPSPTPRYALTEVSFDDDERSARERVAKFAVERVRFLNDKLMLRPIITKSYSQVDQVVSDLGLALEESAKYRGNGQTSLQYGSRFDRALRDCYRAIGCKRSPFIPRGTASAAITERLQAALRSKYGPKPFLDNFIKRFAIQYPNGEPERYGIHLWLRSLDERGVPCYALTLVGSSAFESKEPWYIARNIPIGQESEYAAVQAVYNGSQVVENMGPGRTVRVWHGNVAVPIAVVGAGSTAQLGDSPLDRLTVGALTLTSTKYVVRPTAAESDHDSRSVKDLSVIAELDGDALNELFERLAWAAHSVLARN